MVFLVTFLTTISRRRTTDVKKFVYFLSDSPSYPNEIYANSAAEVKKLILESVPDESQILKIIEVRPNQAAEGGAQAPAPAAQDARRGEDIDPNDFSNANDFFSSVMDAAIEKGKAEPEAKAMEEEAAEEEEAPARQQPQPQPAAEGKVSAPPQAERCGCAEAGPAKFFEEAGIQFKLEGGRIFKRSWVNVSDEDEPMFRIRVRKTGRLADEEKFLLEKLEWVEIKA